MVNVARTWSSRLTRQILIANQSCSLFCVGLNIRKHKNTFKSSKSEWNHSTMKIVARRGNICWTIIVSLSYVAYKNWNKCAQHTHHTQTGRWETDHEEILRGPKFWVGHSLYRFWRKSMISKLQVSFYGIWVGPSACEAPFGFGHEECTNMSTCTCLIRIPAVLLPPCKYVSPHQKFNLAWSWILFVKYELYAKKYHYIPK